MMMTNEKAYEIAEEFIKWMNPTNWDGSGDQPDDFYPWIWEENKLSKKWNLEITYAQDYIDDVLTWCTYVDIVDKRSNDSVDMQSCYGIDSPQNIADAIMCLCKGRE